MIYKGRCYSLSPQAALHRPKVRVKWELLDGVLKEQWYFEVNTNNHLVLGSLADFSFSFGFRFPRAERLYQGNAAGCKHKHLGEIPRFC